jgi:hypothetical protein
MALEAPIGRTAAQFDGRNARMTVPLITPGSSRSRVPDDRDAFDAEGN